MQFFREMAKKGQKRAKYLKISAIMYKIWKYFEKGVRLSHAINCRIGPDILQVETLLDMILEKAKISVSK